MAKILGIGNLVLDTVLTLPHYPSENSENRAQERYFQVGGNVANNLYVLKQLGHSPAIIATLAVDEAAKRLKNTLEQQGIDTQHIQRFIKGATPNSYVVNAQDNATRTITHFRDLPEVEFDHFAKIEIESYDWLHFEGRNLAALPGMLNICQTFLQGQPVSLEVEKPRPGIEALFSQVHLLLFSQSYALSQGYEDPHAFLSAMRSRAPQANLVLSWGEQGAYSLATDGSAHHEAAKKIKAIDTLGAGDTFNAAIIDQLIKGHTLHQALAFANQLAARKCQQKGLDDLLAPLVTRKPIANVKHITSARATVVPAPGLAHKVVLIKYEDEIKAYENNCPHQDVPLDEAYKIDINPFEHTMKCSVHDAFFRIEDGVCVEGPCWRDELKVVDIEIDHESGAIYLAETQSN